jgi:hypothetical protein
MHEVTAASPLHVSRSMRTGIRLALASVTLVAWLGPARANGHSAFDHPLRGRVARQRPGVVNDNARVTARHYNQPHARDLTQYRHFLGVEFDHLVSQLRRGDVWIDSGAGLGVAALQGAQHGVVSYVVNAQDFWAEPLGRSNVHDMVNALAVDQTGIPVENAQVTLWNGQVAQVSSHASLDDGHVEVLARRVHQVKASAERAGLYHYLVGFAEHMIPSIRARAQLVTDLYGAYFYSADRAHLLDVYYDALAPGGTAFVRFATGDGTGPNSVVQTRHGPMSLEQYLVSRHPQVFRLSPGDPSVLIMTRGHGHERLGLADRLSLEATYMIEVDGMQLPSAHFAEH